MTKDEKMSAEFMGREKTGSVNSSLKVKLMIQLSVPSDTGVSNYRITSCLSLSSCYC